MDHISCIHCGCNKLTLEFEIERIELSAAEEGGDSERRYTRNLTITTTDGAVLDLWLWSRSKKELTIRPGW